MYGKREDQAPEITQEMIALFDDYTHVSLDRRKFMDNLAKLAGSMSAATAAFSLMAADAHAQGLVPETDERLATETITYPAANGEMSAIWPIPRTAARSLPSSSSTKTAASTPISRTSPGASRSKDFWRWRRISCRRSAARPKTRTTPAPCFRN